VARIVENARDGGPSHVSVYARESVAAECFDASPEETAAVLAAAGRLLGFVPRGTVRAHA
jgi:hypothetical protein